MSELANNTAPEAETHVDPLGAETPSFTCDDVIAPRHWSKDHWSALAYVNSVMVECGGFEIGSDCRMRSTRRNARVMAEENPRPRRSTSCRPAMAMDSAHHSTRLNNGQMVVGHDDWACLQDMASVNLFDHPVEEVEPGVTLRFSRKGRLWAEAVHEHKRQGGTFSGFTTEALPEMPEAAHKDRETFTWARTRFDVTKMLEDIASGKLRPKRDTLVPAFVENYARRVLGLDKSKPDAAQCGSLLMRIDVANARQLPDAVLKQPAILAHAGKNKGLLKMGEGEADGTDYVLCDGNHRVGRHYLDDLGEMPVYILSAQQSRKYKV